MTCQKLVCRPTEIFQKIHLQSRIMSNNLQHWVDDEFRTVGLDDWSCIFGAEHMRQIGSLENMQDE